jgi:glycosyltransferase involved in cell wall biosynthesis
VTPEPGHDRSLRVLILNWRDLRHPKAGGAEVLTHEHARRLVARGHEVTLISGAAVGMPSDEVIDGVRVVRRGGAVTTRWHAVRWYREQRRGGRRFDVVVEEINTLPYFAGRFASAPAVLWMHQLAREVWWYEAPKLLAPIGYLLENVYLRLSRNCPALVLSDSTRRDLLALGFAPDRVVVVPPGIGSEPPPAAVTTEPGLLVYVGRLTPSKRVPDLIRMLALVRERGVDARLVVVGRGSAAERRRVLQLARSLEVADRFELTGYLAPDAKRALLARASLLVMASAREGWGLVVTEANALGTPAVVYDRPGLRDSTANERTGLLTQPTPAALADAVVRALTEPGLYERLSSGALAWSRQFTWARASAAFEQALLAVARGDGAGLAGAAAAT